MRLCMFHPVDHPMERGWVGRIDGARVVHLAAQTLQSLFTGGGSAREHAEYRLADVRLLAPVLHPPAIRVFESQSSFGFANPAAVVGPGAEVVLDHGALGLCPRVAAVIGAEGAIAGFTGFAEWCRPSAPPPKDRDFAFGLGPVVVTPDEFAASSLAVTVRVDGEVRLEAAVDEFDWSAARDLAAGGTALYPGDLLAGPTVSFLRDFRSRGAVEMEIESIGVLTQVVERE